MAIAQQNRIKFHYQKKVTLPDRRSIKGVIIRILKDAGLKPEAINYIFCSDESLWRINLEYLKHNTYTDIITFDLSEEPGKVIADIYISVDRVRENARQHKATLKDEILRVIFHGALHLSGFKDKSAKEQNTMRIKENEYLGLFHKMFHGTRFRKET